MNRYNGISLPKNLINRIDRIREKYGYTTKADFIREAVRRELDKLEKRESKQ